MARRQASAQSLRRIAHSRRKCFSCMRNGDQRIQEEDPADDLRSAKAKPIADEFAYVKHIRERSARKFKRIMKSHSEIRKE